MFYYAKLELSGSELLTSVRWRFLVQSAERGHFRRAVSDFLVRDRAESMFLGKPVRILGVAAPHRAIRTEIEPETNDDAGVGIPISPTAMLGPDVDDVHWTSRKTKPAETLHAPLGR